MRRVGIVLVALIAIVLLIPVHTTCGAARYSCAVPPDENGFISYYYELEPFGITLIETVLGENLRIYYTSGTEQVQYPPSGANS